MIHIEWRGAGKSRLLCSSYRSEEEARRSCECRLSFHVPCLVERRALKSGFLCSSFITKQEPKAGRRQGKRRTSTRRRNLENNTRNFVLVLARHGMSLSACEKFYKIMLWNVMRTARRRRTTRNVKVTSAQISQRNECLWRSTVSYAKSQASQRARSFLLITRKNARKLTHQMNERNGFSRRNLWF